MRRSKQNLDEWIDQLAAGEPGSRDGDVVAAFVHELGSASFHSESVHEGISGLLAAEALSVTKTVPIRTNPGRTRRPLARKWRRRTMISTFVSTLLGKVAIGTAVLAATTGGLAAADTLPDPAQEWVSEVVSYVGIDIPAPSNAYLPSQTDEAETSESPESPELPENASDSADTVIDTVFEGDPADGKDFGTSVADTASDGSGDVADDYTDGAGDQADDGIDNADGADDYTDGAGDQADDGIDN
ncbi:MAG: hypothetical protein ACC655_07525, partial [Rhodothermia bacterium]